MKTNVELREELMKLYDDACDLKLGILDIKLSIKDATDAEIDNLMEMLVILVVELEETENRIIEMEKIINGKYLQVG